MRLKMLAKDRESGRSGCMTMYEDTDNPAMMVVQARRAGRRARAQMANLRLGEVAGLIPAETVIRAAREYLDAHPGAGQL